MKCSYCLTEIPKGTGTMFVTKAGAISYFCSSRCYQFSAVMHRKLRKNQETKAAAPKLVPKAK